MAGYEKQTWVDKISDVTAERMNHIEKGIEDAGKTGGVETGSVIGWTGAEIPEGYEEVDSSLLPANDGVPTGTIVEWEEDEIPEGYEEVEKDIINSTSITDKENKTYSANVIDGLIAPQMITTILSANQTTTSSDEKVNLNKVYGSCGNKLTLSNNEVVIGENINIVEISANVHLVYNSPAGSTSLKILKNDIEVVAVSENKPNASQGAQIVFTPIIISVKKGDKIAISYTGGSGHILTSYRTYMTIKKIK